MCLENLLLTATKSCCPNRRPTAELRVELNLSQWGILIRWHQCFTHIRLDLHLLLKHIFYRPDLHSLQILSPIIIFSSLIQLNASHISNFTPSFSFSFFSVSSFSYYYFPLPFLPSGSRSSHISFTFFFTLSFFIL